jgi:hypothetical protein
MEVAVLRAWQAEECMQGNAEVFITADLKELPCKEAAAFAKRNEN